MLPSGPSVIASGVSGKKPGNLYSVTAPAVVIRPIDLVPKSVNNRLPSVPAVIRYGNVPEALTGNSVIAPALVARPILPIDSVNHSLPSGPAAIPWGFESVVGVSK